MKDMESRGKQFGFPWSAFCSQWGDHHVGYASEEGLNPSLYDLGLERPQVDALPYHNQLVDAPSGGPTLASLTRASAPPEAGMAALHWQESSRATLVVDHDVERWSISLSRITLIILPIVQVPTTKGTLRPELDSSGTTRNTASSSKLQSPILACTG